MSPLVTIITPVYNGGKLIENTIVSVLEQTYSNIEYIIVDGASCDNTLTIVNKHKHKIKQVISEPDEGMYHALSKGFSICNGEIICYINAGDWLYPSAIETVVEVFNNNSIQWFTGYRSTCNENNVVTRVELPFRYKRKMIQTCIYGRYLPYIQQESTFWRKSMLSNVNFKLLSRLKLAGDYYLWNCFSKKARLEIVGAPLGVFMIHSGQLSENLKPYWDETKLFRDSSSFFVYIKLLYEMLFWVMSPDIRKLFVNNIYEYNHKDKKWLFSFKFWQSISVSKKSNE
ncbi:MAG: glycosyltransferase involved in cell wall biosynthesis [Flavobacteriaceae bacterium]|jgi:glycosyltransferase involved in cell wall biosynthesis